VTAQWKSSGFSSLVGKKRAVDIGFPCESVGQNG